MIELYYWTTPNGHKITMFLEEAGVPYTIFPIHIGKGEQFAPDFLKIAPNNRIPAIRDTAPTDGGAPISVFESGAILEYLGDKTGKFLPKEARARAEVVQWTYWQMGGLGPMAGQNHHFAAYAPEKIPYAIDRYQREARRLFEVMERQLADHPFIANDEYSIADIALWCWVAGYEWSGVNIDGLPGLKRWLDLVGSRPAVQKGRAVPPPPTPEERAKTVESAKKMLA
jgi:GST-like protein